MITEIVHGKRIEHDHAQMPTIILEGILIIGRSRLIFLADLVGVEPMVLPTGLDLLITIICGTIILMPIIKERYPYVIDVKSWDIMLMNVLTRGSPKIMFPYVEIVKRQDIPRMSVQNLKKIISLMIETERKENTSIFKRMGKADLEM